MATWRNATSCETVERRLALEPNVRGGNTFPIPLQTRSRADLESTNALPKRRQVWHYHTLLQQLDRGPPVGTVTKASEQSTFVERPLLTIDVEGRDIRRMYTRVVTSVSQATSASCG